MRLSPGMLTYSVEKNTRDDYIYYWENKAECLYSYQLVWNIPLFFHSFLSSVGHIMMYDIRHHTEPVLNQTYS